MITRLIPLAALSAVLSLCQPDNSLPEFEAASLHRIDPNERIPGISKKGGPGTRSPAVFTCRYCTLSMFVAIGFNLRPYQIVLPASLDDEHYMLNARLPPNASKEDFQGMMQRLLKERFQLSYRMVDKTMTGYIVKVAKGGSKLRASTLAPESGVSAELGRHRPPELKMGEDGFPILPEGPGLSLVSIKAGTRLKSNAETMAGFAGILSDQMHEPVIDGTSLAGRYDIALTWSNDLDSAAWPPLEAALASQLGLKLERDKVTVPVLVADHAERSPDN